MQVLESPYVNPAQLLDVVPPHLALLPIRVLLLERLGCHREALLLLTRQLAAPHQAEEYCDRVYRRALAAAESEATAMGAGPKGTPPAWAPAPAPDQAADIYLVLLQVIPCLAASWGGVHWM